MCLKLWQRLHCSEPFGDTYGSTDTRKPQSSVSDRTFDTSGPRATDTMKWGWGAVLGAILVATPGSQLYDFLDTNVQGFELLPDDALRRNPIQVLYQKSTQRSSRSVKVWKLTPSISSRDRSALTAARNPSAVNGTTINFSPFSWAVRPQG